MGANLVTVDFLELQRDSRVTTGNSGCLLCWPREVQSSIRVVKESWGLLSSDCRANRPHLGLCPEANVPLQRRKGSRGCIPDAPARNCRAAARASSSFAPAIERERSIATTTLFAVARLTALRPTTRLPSSVSVGGAEAAAGETTVRRIVGKLLAST